MKANGKLMLYNAKELTITINQTDFDYIKFGRGKRALIMIQGLNTGSFKGMSLPLAYMYRIFAKEYTVYLFDRRPKLESGITVRDFASDIADAMDALGISKADVLGVSQGGMIAQYLAIDRPDLVNKIVLALTLSKNNNTATEAIDKWVSLTRKGDMRGLIVDMAEKMYSEKYMKLYRPLLPLLTEMQKPRDVERFILLAESCLTCSAYDELHKINCPVMVIGAECDKIVGPDASREIAERMQCELYMYKNLGHAAYEEASDFNRRVYDFFQKS